MKNLGMLPYIIWKIVCGTGILVYLSSQTISQQLYIVFMVGGGLSLFLDGGYDIYNILHDKEGTRE